MYKDTLINVVKYLVITDPAVLTNILLISSSLDDDFLGRDLIISIISASDTGFNLVDIFTSLGSSIVSEGILCLMFSPMLTKSSLNFSATSEVDGSGLVSDIHEANLIKLFRSGFS